MTSIDRTNAYDATRSYVQQTDAARTAAASAAQAQYATRAKQGAAPRTDSVSFSADARALASARATVASAPDVRESKVADIKHQIDTGTYQVSARVLARKMVDAAANPD
jgi:negative regulator of flagellin synthesis FlgM